MTISEKKMQIVIDNYFKSECDVNTSIRQAFEKGFRIGIKKLPSAQPDYTAIKYEIQRNIDDFYNSEHHAQHVSSNGRMIAFGLELALDIVKDAERRTDECTD